MVGIDSCEKYGHLTDKTGRCKHWKMALTPADCLRALQDISIGSFIGLMRCWGEHGREGETEELHCIPGESSKAWVGFQP